MKNVTLDDGGTVIPLEGGKVCFRCHVWKPYYDSTTGEPSFVRAASRKDGFTNLCRDCKAGYNRDQYERDPQATIKRVMEWQQKNIDKHRARQRDMAKRKREDSRRKRVEQMREEGKPVKPW